MEFKGKGNRVTEPVLVNYASQKNQALWEGDASGWYWKRMFGVMMLRQSKKYLKKTDFSFFLANIYIILVTSKREMRLCTHGVFTPVKSNLSARKTHFFPILISLLRASKIWALVLKILGFDGPRLIKKSHCTQYFFNIGIFKFLHFRVLSEPQVSHSENVAAFCKSYILFKPDERHGSVHSLTLDIFEIKLT